MSEAVLEPPVAGAATPPVGSPPAGSAAGSPPVGNGAIQPFHSDWMKADGTLNSASYERLPEDVRYMKDTLGKYKTAEELVRGMAYAQTLAGKKGLLPLPDNAPAEVRAERKAVLDSINGVPKEAKDYGITRPADISEAHWNQPLAENFAKWAQENSVNPNAVKKLLGVQIDAMKAQVASQAQYEQKFYADQAKVFNDQIRLDNIPAEKANALAEQAAVRLGFDLNNEQDKRVLQNAKVRLAMVRHAISTGEDSFVQGESPNGSGGDAASLAADASRNKANPLYEPLYNPSHPQHRMAVEKVNQWWAAAAARKK